MNVLGMTSVWLISVALVVWIVDLVRRDRLYVGYGVIFVGAIGVGGVCVPCLPGSCFAATSGSSPLWDVGWVRSRVA